MMKTPFLLLAFVFALGLSLPGLAQAQGADVMNELPSDAVVPVPEEALLEPVERAGSIYPDTELGRFAAELAQGVPENAGGTALDIPALNNLKSLFFTHWQYTAIQDARNSRGFVRPLSGQEREQVARQVPNNFDDGVFMPPVEPGERNIRLGGILFTGENDWTIWINDKRVTPEALPEEVMDLKVYADYVEMKWVDEYTNQIYPLRLKPHQRFNLDSRIFLPG